MKKVATLFLLLLASYVSLAQEWSIPVEAEGTWYFHDVISVDNCESALGIGYINDEDGFLLKVNKDGNCFHRTSNLPSMMLQYHSAVQLNNGNYMVFGVCDDSLCDHHYQKYLRVDVFDDQLQPVSERTYCVDDDVFDCFFNPNNGLIMNAIISKSGTVILATILRFYVEQFGGYYKPALRFYVFDDLGDTLKIIDNPIEMSSVSNVKEITYEPHSDCLMIVVDGGVFGYDSGIAGVYVADSSLNIIAHQSMLHLGGAAMIDDNACEGRWFDDNRILFDCAQYIGSHFTYHTLYIADSALNVYAELRLPPHDSCTWVPDGTSTSYVNDSTIFALTYCSQGMSSFDNDQINVILTDKHLNLLGRKVIRTEDAQSFAGQPVAFSEGGCLVPIYTRNCDYHQGDPFFQGYLMKIRREDIEITWDVVKEKPLIPSSSIYPNPSQGIINIAIEDTFNEEARIQIYDIKGAKCLDSSIGKTGNTITLDTQNLDAGLYVYKVVSGNKELASGKFIKE